MTIAESQGSEGSELESQGTGEPEGDGLASGFLSKIPEGDRDIVGKYVKQWDAGVTRRFQDLHSKYKPYEELGLDVETLQQAAELYSILDEDPQRIYSALREAFEEDEGSEDLSEEQKQGLESNPLQGTVTEMQERLDQQTQVLEAVAQYILDMQGQTQAQSEDSELEEYLGLLKEEFGEFDEKYVLTQMFHGTDGAQAVAEWQEMIQEKINGASQATSGLPAAVLSSSGGSAVPVSEQQSMGSIPSKDVRALVADVLSQVSREGR
jgi:hypothetical protein